MVNDSSAGLVRFGPFELNLRSAELYNEGQKVQLQDQPFQILRLLTESPCEVVTRDEIRSRLWPDDTIVEFENAINAAIKKLRIALGDSVEEPRYVETVKRRGYRLMVPVERVPVTVREKPTLFGENVSAEPVPTLAPTQKQTAAKQTHRKAVATAAILIFCMAAGFVYFQRASPPRPELKNKDKILLGEFLNKTGDPVFDGTLRQGLRVQLEQSPFFSLVSDERIQQVLQLMGQAEGTPITPEIAGQICARTGSAAVVDGSITSLGSKYVLGLRAKDCRNGGILAEEQLQASGKEDVLNALGLIAVKLRTRVGESQSTVARFSTPLADATTSSLDALKAYSEGFRVLSSTGSAAALPFFKRATEIDPEFAMAHAHLGMVYSSVGESTSLLRVSARRTSCAIAPAKLKGSSSPVPTTST